MHTLEGAYLVVDHEIPLFYSGISLDLLIIKDGKKIGVECKRVDAPRLTPSMLAAKKDLELSTLLVIYPGSKRYSLAEDIRTVPLSNLAEEGVL